MPFFHILLSRGEYRPVSSDGDLPLVFNDDDGGWRKMETLYRDHATWLRSALTRRLRAQPADVDDILQDTWLRAAAGRTSDIEHPKAFLSRIALNLFRDRKRREDVRRDHRRMVFANDAATPSVQPGLMEQEAAAELEKLIVELPETYRDVFVLSRFRHMTNADIAAHLGISIKTVEWRIGKALELCMIRLRG
jgi:RNA polymerase sigma-70 factor (ECF subfamily)